MLIRRTLLLTSILVLVWAGPAHATHTYEHVLPASQGATVDAPDAEGAGVARVEGDLARTGRNDVVPLIQAGMVLMGGGLLLVLVARRRRVALRTATT